MRKNETQNTNIIIECNAQNYTINGTKITFPCHINNIEEILGEPSRMKYDLLWRVVWDDLGIYFDYASSESIQGITLLKSNNHQLEFFPKCFFKGKVFVNKEEVQNQNFINFKLEKNEVIQLIYEGEQIPYAIGLERNFDYEEKIPENKYLLKKPKGTVLNFKDFGFKLAVINELMYNREILKPKFDLNEFIKGYQKRKIDIDEEGYEIIPEIMEYFKNIELTAKMVKDIDELVTDGGDYIYMQICPFWSGEDDIFNIKSVVDSDLLPNLKEVTIFYDDDDSILTEFKNKGIKANWI